MDRRSYNFNRLLSKSLTVLLILLSYACSTKEKDIQGKYRVADSESFSLVENMDSAFFFFQKDSVFYVAYGYFDHEERTDKMVENFISEYRIKGDSIFINNESLLEDNEVFSYYNKHIEVSYYEYIADIIVDYRLRFEKDSKERLMLNWKDEYLILEREE